MLDLPYPWDSTVVIVADGKLAPSDCFVTGNSNNN
ncbi:hypothetical protein Rleg5DRAFT_1321 [Rhizobium leguminosarum bv. viciae WSM1455]|nr:hypothetical protein Rleg5DRAFT_1321 [Rhizobium leguminosarum bv. viciae WSM1455]